MLAARLDGAPEVLRERVFEALAASDEGRGVRGEGRFLDAEPGELRAAANRLRAEACAAPSTRHSALTLLAADALITLAVELDLAASLLSSSSSLD